MMKRLLLLLISVAISVATNADGIGKNEALLKAQRLMPGKRFVAADADAMAPSVPAKLKGKSQPYYIFNAVDGGFVIVSGDDRATDILGYSYQGHLDTAAMPANLRWWLQGYAREIEELEAMSLAAEQAEDKPAVTPIAPMIMTQWNQNEPYNSWCPDGSYVDYYEDGYNAANRCFAGCVATTMAQLMYYWQWPATCGALDSYEVDEHTIKGLPATTFKWDLMQNTYSRTASGDAVDAVAELMRYCGQAIQMGYGVDSSSGYVSAELLASTFQYSPNCCRLYRDNYTAIRWASIIYRELAAHRPVVYHGDSDTSAHLFLIDGCDASGLVHINWGWSGRYDGYFSLSAANPDANRSYKYNQTAFINLQPAVPGEKIRPAMQCCIDDSEETFLHYRSESATLEGTVVAQYTLEPDATQNAEIGWALYQGDTFVKVLSSKAVTISAEQQDHFLNNSSVIFDETVPAGNYLLCQIYRFEGETEWQICHPYRDYAYMLVLELTDTYFYTRPYNMLTDGITTIGYQAAENGGRNGAESVGNSAGTGSWYNLQGIQVPQPRKGLFIKDGRSILVP